MTSTGQSYAADLQQRTEMYPYFIGLFATGCFFLFLSLWSLPFFVIAPRKTANLINIGSICIISSFAVIKGPYQFLIKDLLLHPTKWLVAWLYVLSICLTFYSSMVLKMYLPTIGALVIELTCLMYFICSYFPGGQQGMQYIMQFLATGAK